eukprot:10453816-Alexandrium_andersonii.AAC.1
MFLRSLRRRALVCLYAAAFLALAGPAVAADCAAFAARCCRATPRATGWAVGLAVFTTCALQLAALAALVARVGAQLTPPPPL